jgi:hypothetical protein
MIVWAWDAATQPQDPLKDATAKEGNKDRQHYVVLGMQIITLKVE